MADALYTMPVEDILQCLADSGCDKAAAAKFMDSLKAEDRNGAMKILEDHRKYLLDTLHGKQKCIDCLDYLIWQIKKQEKLQK
jgi:hypothetical protein